MKSPGIGVREGTGSSDKDGRAVGGMGVDINFVGRAQAAYCRQFCPLSNTSVACSPFDSWMQQAEEDLEDNLIIHSADEVTALTDVHELFRESLSEAKADFDTLDRLAGEVDQVVQQNSLADSLACNPYTHVSAQGLSERWNSVRELETKRSQLLLSAAQKQREIGSLQQHFAKLAQQLDSGLEEALKQCHAIGVSGDGTLEQQLSSLQHLQSQSQFDSQLDSLEKCDKQLEDFFVFERSQTPLSLDKVRIKYGQLKSNLKTTMNQIENQILTRDSKGLTQAQMDEYRRCFNHFDRDRTQRLEPTEFKALLVSLEYSITSGDHKSFYAWIDDKRWFSRRFSIDDM
ncbi:actinin alpha 2 [Cichlidogyrus casuarinus]|uniref:Actinin alpha 2 n=1 Tax=Cichlidogyrus casuarinus TaxID=1844966 RepID=A0ABD2Q0Y5_9PLAT